jgi:hypothetical protein
MPMPNIVGHTESEKGSNKSYPKRNHRSRGCRAAST